MRGVEIQQRVGAAVRAERTRRGISQEALADEAGLHRTYIGSVERGERNLSLLNLWRIAVALEVAPSRLLAAAENKESSDGRRKRRNR
jgi:transcriptional regulator with XRE-family HTH domain